MRALAEVIIKELRGKNPGFDTIKRYVRVVAATAEVCGSPLTTEEAIDIMEMCVSEIPFDPLADIT